MSEQSRIRGYEAAEEHYSGKGVEYRRQEQGYITLIRDAFLKSGLLTPDYCQGKLDWLKEREGKEGMTRLDLVIGLLIAGGIVTLLYHGLRWLTVAMDTMTIGG